VRLHQAHDLLKQVSFELIQGLLLFMCSILLCSAYEQLLCSTYEQIKLLCAVLLNSMKEGSVSC